MKVEFSDSFAERFLGFDKKVQDVVVDFATHVGMYGLKGLQGRNKSSVPINPHTKKQRENAKYAQKHCLWHYHIGIPEYVGEQGDMTSELVLHYQRLDDKIILVDVLAHPPFSLPVI